MKLAYILFGTLTIASTLIAANSAGATRVAAPEPAATAAREFVQVDIQPGRLCLNGVCQGNASTTCFQTSKDGAPFCWAF